MELTSRHMVIDVASRVGLLLLFAIVFTLTWDDYPRLMIRYQKYVPKERR